MQNIDPGSAARVAARCSANTVHGDSVQCRRYRVAIIRAGLDLVLLEAMRPEGCPEVA